MINKIKKYLNTILRFFWDDQYKYETDITASQKMVMLNFIVIILMVFLIPFGLLTLSQNNLFIGYADLGVALAVILARIHSLKNNNYIFLTFFIITFLGLFFLFLIFDGGANNSGALWSYTFPITAVFMLGREKGRIYIILFILSIILIFFADYSVDVYSVNYKLRFMGSLIAVSIVVYFLELIRENLNKTLIKKNKELEKSFQKLEIKERELVEREKYYRTLFESSNDAIFIMEDGVFKECNPKTFEMYGCKKEEIINQSPIKFSPEFQPSGRNSAEMAKEKIDAALNGEPQFFEWVHYKLNGRGFNAEVSLDLIELDNKKLIQATVRDITIRKISDEELKIAKEAAEKSDRLKSDFLAQMSHEIRTPINTIMNYTSLLKMEFEDNVSEDNEGSFLSIHNAAHRLLRTIDLILNISDLEAGTYDPKFEMNDLAEHIIIPVVNEFTQAAQNKNLSLTFTNETSYDSKTVLDNYTVYQTVANLVDNAIKYTEKGEIVVSLTKMEKKFVIKIKDSGVGISKEYIPSLFDKFSQEEAGYTRRYEGSGLGLALVKKYCEINGIEISVESVKGFGTSFILELPITSVPEPVC